MVKLRNILQLWLLIVRKKKWNLKFISLWWWTSRKRLMIKILDESLKNVKEFAPVIINTSDRPINRYMRINVFSFSTMAWYYDKIIPDWTYDSWIECKIPQFNKITEEIEKAWHTQPLLNKIWWIWNINTSPTRTILLKLWDEYPEYLDIKDSNNTKYMSLPDLVRTYGYLIDVEWYGFSWRLKYLFFSWRPVFVQERLLEEYALIWAVPNIHYIPVKNDFSDLIWKFEKITPKNFEKIWQNGKIFATKNLSKEKAYEYIYKEFINIKKQKIKFNNCKIILFVLIILSKHLYWKIRGIINFLIKK